MPSTAEKMSGSLGPATGIHETNSHAAEELRVRIQKALPWGTQPTVATRSGASLRSVRAQIQGEDPLTVKVAIEALASVSREAAIEALDELLGHAGLAVIARPAETHDAVGLLTANAALLVGISEVERELGVGLADGVLTPRESVQIAAALTETRLRIDALLRHLGVSR